MKSLRRFFVRLFGFSGWARRDREMADELEFHRQLQIDENLRRGLSPEEARRTAALQLGSLDSAKETLRNMQTLPWLSALWQDLRYAWRGLRRTPGFTAATLLSIVLGLGSSIAIFTIVDNLLLRPLPFRDPSSLMMMWEHKRQSKALEFNVVSPANYLDWRAQASVFEKTAALGGGTVVFSDGQRVQELVLQAVTADFWPLLGVQPQRGRVFTASEDLPGRGNVILISHRLWQEWFAGSNAVIGRRVQINAAPREIIGVLPAGFAFRNREIDLWQPLGLDPATDYRKTSGRYLLAVARLKPGVTQREAQAQLTAVAQRLEQANPKFDANWTATLEPLRDSMVREVKSSLWLLLGAVGLLLAVASANVANLLLARYTSRRREMAVRASIGAGRWRVIRQLLTESTLLALIGGVLGLGLARGAILGLVALAPKALTRSGTVEMDVRVILMALGISLLTGLLFGLVPALVASSAQLTQVLQEEARSVSGGGRRLRGLLVASEVALSVMLLAGAGLLFRSLTGLQAVPSGLDPSSVLTFRISIPRSRYPEVAQRTQFFERAVEQMGHLPGVRAVSSVSFLPFDGMAAGTYVNIAGRPIAKAGEENLTIVRTVLPGYFQTMGIPLVRGRDFTSGDNADHAPGRFVVNEAFVRQFLPGSDGLGQSIQVLMNDPNPFGEIIGVVGDVREDSLSNDAKPTVYYPYAQLSYTGMVFVVRSAVSPMSLAEPIGRLMRGLDANQPIAAVRTMDEIMAETLARHRFSALLLMGFSLISLALAGVGVYGVLAYSVAERQREIGLRMALGATPQSVVALVTSAGARFAGLGLLVGMAGAFALSGLLKSLLYGIGPRDPVTFLTVPALLSVVAGLAAYLPARRAARLDPMAALRME